ncbi:MULTISPECIES: MarR family winged helix-turn-helix transcriptional regulator [unclassified Fictibacillus]|uniref:MarR family winged helix-turn-helix transcriptional regulator n=1 Tax=unclassified Fictibacillus TaxID=2644029 RepID=UPI0007839FD0|nr:MULTISPECIES: MarR family transcriptional regulator [unclassified Fictibacillus]MED2973992.1 MarR family transcriptional regulator [Fictibacillus sp. B-59209]UZJ78124.1 MarR family transcriptional regulator [Fictibacillus sp. KU28468]
MKIEGLKAYVEKLEVAHYILSKSLHPETTGEGDLTRTQYILMRMLSVRDRWTVTELAEMLEVKPSAVTVAVDRLYKKNYVQRYRSEADRRIVYLELSETGIAILHEAEERRLVSMENLLSKLSQEEREMLITIYGKFGKNTSQSEELTFAP